MLSAEQNKPGGCTGVYDANDDTDGGGPREAAAACCPSLRRSKTAWFDAPTHWSDITPAAHTGRQAELVVEE